MPDQGSSLDHRPSQYCIQCQYKLMDALRDKGVELKDLIDSRLSSIEHSFADSVEGVQSSLASGKTRMDGFDVAFKNRDTLIYTVIGFVFVAFLSALASSYNVYADLRVAQKTIVRMQQEYDNHKVEMKVLEMGLNDLKTQVKVCAQSHESVNRRLDRIEEEERHKEYWHESRNRPKSTPRVDPDNFD